MSEKTNEVIAKAFAQTIEDFIKEFELDPMDTKRFFAKSMGENLIAVTGGNPDITEGITRSAAKHGVIIDQTKRILTSPEEESDEKNSAIAISIQAGTKAIARYYDEDPNEVFAIFGGAFGKSMANLAAYDSRKDIKDVMGYFGMDNVEPNEREFKQGTEVSSRVIGKINRIYNIPEKELQRLFIDAKVEVVAEITGEPVATILKRAEKNSGVPSKTFGL